MDVVMKLLQSDWAIRTAVAGAVGLFIWKMPKVKTGEAIGKAVYWAACRVSAFGNTRIGRILMIKVEEGILLTVSYWARIACDRWDAGLVHDNGKEPQK
jgi:hypothetical protein